MHGAQEEATTPTTDIAIGNERQVAHRLPGHTYEWIAWKAEYNESTHGVTFQEAASAFDDNYGYDEDDVAHSEHEQRFWWIGRSAFFRTLLVVHCYRLSESNRTRIHIISAWSASKKDAMDYLMSGAPLLDADKEEEE